MMKKVGSSKKTYLIQDYSAETIPSDAGHTYIADIREHPPPLGQNQSEVSQVNTFRSALTVITDTCVDNLN